jgi:hypothetical protein
VKFAAECVWFDTAAWFLGHRIREAMKDGGGKLGGPGVTVEADEVFIGKSPKTRRAPGEGRTTVQILSLVERGGRQRSVFLDHRTVRAALYENLDFDSRLVTDGHVNYRHLLHAGHHASVDHSKGEYVRGDVHVNTLEGFFSIFKRGLIGVYQHVDKKHLQRYATEFDFRMNNRIALGIDDEQRTANAVAGAAGKRLTYTTPSRGTDHQAGLA